MVTAPSRTIGMPTITKCPGRPVSSNIGDTHCGRGRGDLTRPVHRLAAGLNVAFGDRRASQDPAAQIAKNDRRPVRPSDDQSAGEVVECGHVGDVERVQPRPARRVRQRCWRLPDRWRPKSRGPWRRSAAGRWRAAAARPAECSTPRGCRAARGSKARARRRWTEDRCGVGSPWPDRAILTHDRRQPCLRAGTRPATLTTSTIF